MYPLIDFGDFKLPLYSLCILTGIVCGFLTAFFRSKRKNLNRDDILHIFVLAAIGLIIGGKLLYLITAAPDIWAVLNSENPENILFHLTGGFVYYGGLIGGLLVVIFYIRKYELPFWDYLDCTVISVPLMHAFGRIGCFFAGCCYGIQADPPWGVYFVNSPFVPHDEPHLPTQLYESGINLIIFLVLALLYRKDKLKAGGYTAMYFIMYATARFGLEFLRGDPDRGELLGVSTSQWISIALLIVGIFLLLRKPKHPSLKDA